MTWQYQKFSFGSENVAIDGSNLKYSSINSDQTYSFYILTLKRALVEVPGSKWSVIASNSATQFAPIGSPNPDVWTTNIGLEGLNTQWCLIERTSGEQILISGWQNQVDTISISLTGSYAGGDASTIPSATDEVELLGFIDGRFFELATIHVFWKEDGTSHRIFIRDDHLTHGIICCEKLIPESGSEEIQDMVFFSSSSGLTSAGVPDPLDATDLEAFLNEHSRSGRPKTLYITRGANNTILSFANGISINDNEDTNTIYRDFTKTYSPNVSPYSYEESIYGILLLEPIRLFYLDKDKFQSVGKMADCYIANSLIARSGKAKVNKGILDEYYYFFGAFGQLVDENLVIGES